MSAVSSTAEMRERPVEHVGLLPLQEMACALPLALAKAGNSMAARIAMMAITTRSSIKVKPAVHLVDKAMGAQIELRFFTLTKKIVAEHK